MKRILYFYEPDFNTWHEKAKQAQSAYKRLLDEFLRLDLIVIKTIDDLVSLSSGGESKLREMISEELEVQAIGKFRMKKSVLVDSLDLPDLSLLLELGEACKLHASLTGYLVLNGGKVELNSGEIQKRKDGFSVIAENNDQAKVGEDYLKFIESLNNLHTSLGKAGCMQVGTDLKVSHYAILVNNKIVPSPLFYELLRTQFQAKG